MKRTDAIPVARRAAFVATLLALAGCAPLATSEGRASRSSLGCMRAAVDARAVDEEASDATAHCLAAGLIARRCSVGEALLASLGKEIQDAFGAGDASWRDLAADRRGVRCARRTTTQEDFTRCCAAEP